jgi:hypothetical protein
MGAKRVDIYTAGGPMCAHRSTKSESFLVIELFVFYVLYPIARSRCFVRPRYTFSLFDRKETAAHNH